MKRRSHALVFLLALGYAAPSFLLAPIHALEAVETPDCRDCEDDEAAGPLLVADCSGEDAPCDDRRHHHHRAPHHPGKCQLCSSLAETLAGVLSGGAPASPVAVSSIPEVRETLPSTIPFDRPRPRGPPVNII